MNDVVRMGLADLSKGLTRRELSALDIVDSYCQRMASFDPRLNAFRQTDLGGAREQAKASDQRKRRLGPLDGIPIAAKENIAIQGLVTRSGIGPRSEEPAKQDAEIIRRLRAAGAIILGHTSMHEGALGATNDNPHYGRTHNPWRHGFTPGGSSGGSAAAVAARLCPLALGTDTMGSIRLPAAYCGVVGYKPSRGLIANTGIEPLSRDLDQVGPIARTAADLRSIFEALVITEPIPTKTDLRTLRIARLTNVDDVDLSDDVGAAFGHAIKTLDYAGVQVLGVTLEGYDPGKARRAALLLIEAEAADHFRADRKRYPSAFSDTFTGLLDYGASADSDRLVSAEATIERVRSAYEELFETIDLLVMPTAPQVAFSFDQSAPSNQADLTALANFADAPAASLPMALDSDGMPIGLQLLGRRGADQATLAVAAALEAMLGFQLPDLPRGDFA